MIVAGMIAVRERYGFGVDRMAIGTLLASAQITTT
jgi:hypothetical protein